MDAVNFGRNVSWPVWWRTPRSLEELREALDGAGDRQVRAVGALHSWSDCAAAAEGLSIDLRADAFRRIDLSQTGAAHVTVGAGCPLGELQKALRDHGRTLPTMGAILRQTVAGAISTGTHGSGAQCLSHFVKRVKLAHTGPDGRTVIREYAETDADRDTFNAARCGVGCTGILVEVELETVPRYFVEQTVRVVRSLDEVLASLASHPLGYFAYVPYHEYFVVFERRRVPGPGNGADRWRAWWHRQHQHWAVDWVSHVIVKVAAWTGLGKRTLGGTRFLLWKNAPWIDEDYRILTFRHDAVRHEEMELFVRRDRLGQALAAIRIAIEEAGRQGGFVMHYPVALRRVPPDSTLISMTSADDAGDWFSISFFSYQRPGARGPYREFCARLARDLAPLGARPHWGKLFPLGRAEVERLYPKLPQFRAVCDRLDPARRFRNAFTARVLGLAPR